MLLIVGDSFRLIGMGLQDLIPDAKLLLILAGCPSVTDATWMRHEWGRRADIETSIILLHESLITW